MKKIRNKKIFRNKAILICFTFCFFSVIIGNFSFVNDVFAAHGLEGVGYGSAAVTTNDPALNANTEKGWIQQKIDKLKQYMQDDFLADLWNELGVKAYYAALKYSLNTIAYDTATWIGSGGEGQEPLFISEGWGDYLANIADNAAGTFIETFATESGATFNLCELDTELKGKIGLGLVQYSKPSAPACTFSQMKENWTEALQSNTFLSDFQNSLEPTSSEFGIALSLYDKLLISVDKETANSKLGLSVTKGWLDIRNIAGNLEGYPGVTEDRKDQAFRVKEGPLNTTTEHPFTDAINIFLNQLALTLFNTLMANLNADSTTSSYDWDSLSDFDSSGYSGIAGMDDMFRVLLEPDFTIRGDYEILAELTTCPDSSNAGPTNCVIEDAFRQGIENRMTVGEALDNGYLNGSGVFGFMSDGLEPEYNEGYPYRSMIILRKFRILPISWEIAAQALREYPTETGASRNLEDMVSCYDDEDGYTTYSAGWCKGLIDPNWVLKAPLNYCKKEGSGPEIIFEQISGEDEDSELNISRNDEYCGDEQSCIKENEDGSCELYGYCTKERRKWNFGSDSCEARNNTCQTFESSEGDTISYLENTLDFCGSGNAGCSAYCMDYNYENDAWCGEDNPNKIYFNNSVDECDDSDEGCHEFIRTNDDLDVNLLYNASFEEWESDSEGYEGEVSYNVTGDINFPFIINAQDYSLAGEMFTLSFYSKGCDSGTLFGLEIADTEVIAGTEWQFNQTSHLYTLPGNQINIMMDIVSDDDDCFVDAVKLERGGEASAYSDYRGAGLIYEKLLPSYLENDCSSSDPPAECDDYAKKCTYSEVDCNMYSSMTRDLEIPAKVTPTDYCDEECVGFNTYVESETVFNSSDIKYLIPKSATKCSSSYVGCDEFTNLDEIGEGAEEKEYYTSLKQCVIPSSDCADFYTWEGSDESGYQLKVFSLKEDDESGPVDIISGGDEGCNAQDDYDPLLNPLCLEYYDTAGTPWYRYKYNTVTCSDNCHPYRRTEKNIASELLTSSDCTDSGSAYGWSNEESICYFCKSNGVWNSSQGACVYMAIPGEGLACSESANGCREYVGDTGNNMENIAIFDFESGDTDGWSAVSPATATLSNTSISTGGHSLFVGGDDYEAEVILEDIVNENSIYTLNFLAKNDTSASDMTICIENDLDGSPACFNSFDADTGTYLGNVTTSLEWEMYTVNIDLSDYGFVVDGNEKLVLSSESDFYIDSIMLTEIVDTYYLIKDSWITPDSCNENIYGEPHPLHDLECDKYTDNNNKVHYLHSFTSLCAEDAVGCELMIDTHNYSEASAGSWDVNPNVTIEQDEFVFMVYDKDKLCSESNKGCERLGKEYNYENQSIYSDNYYKNDPDDYDQILCGTDDLGCEEWIYSGGSVYFKDPVDMACEWRQTVGQTTGGYAWYKKEVNRCDDYTSATIYGGNGVIDITTDNDGEITILETNVCLTSSNCGDPSSVSGSYVPTFCTTDSDCNPDGDTNYKCEDEVCRYACITDTNDYLCETSSLKTFGTGGIGNAVDQPTIDDENYWAGLCSVDESGCSELIDPISKFSTNIIFNPDFSINVDDNSIPDGWSSDTEGEQDVTLEPNTLYILAVTGSNEATVTIESDIMHELGSDNNLVFTDDSLSTSSSGDRKSKRFYIASNDTDMSATVRVSNSGFNNGSKIELKRAIVDYQIEDDLDTTTCNATVNFEEGCVLFNKREMDGSILEISSWDADLTYDDGIGASPSVGDEVDRDSNVLLKVLPDRVCGEWLACTSYIKDEDDDKVCFGIGLCNSVDNNGLCDNLLSSKKENLWYYPDLDTSVVSKEDLNNFSGYVKASYYDNFFNADYYPLDAMDQVGELTNFSNGDFEIYGSNYYPLGWYAFHDAGIEYEPWDENKFSVIDNPVSAQDEGIDYTSNGKAFLKFSPSEGQIESEYINVEPEAEYILSFKMNTLNFEIGTGFNYIAAQIAIVTYDSSGNFSILLDDNGNVNGTYGNDFIDYDEDNCAPDPSYNGCGQTVEAGYDWEDYATRFKVGKNTAKIKILIRGVLWFGTEYTVDDGYAYACSPAALCEREPGDTLLDYCFNTEGVDGGYVMTSDACAGNVYIDDIKIRPALENAESSIVTQTCRLYPEDDSLSCSYYEDSGIKKKGLLGYCLEYDRYPGNTDACLLWYPVDKVKGEGIEEGAGYNGKYPVYYCVEGDLDADDFYELPGHTFGFGIDEPEAVTDGYDTWFYMEDEWNDELNDQYWDIICSDVSYTSTEGSGTEEEEFNRYLAYYYEITGLNPDEWEARYRVNIGNATNADNDCPGLSPSYDFDGNNSDTDSPSYQVHITNSTYCTKLVQTVTPVGENKYWSGRVYSGSDFSFVCNTTLPGQTQICEYATDSTPFGSVVPPGDDYSIISNPCEWDSKDRDGNQPLALEEPDTTLSEPYQARMGQLHNETYLKHIFAESYGTWIWNVTEAKYEKSEEVWSPPEDICQGTDGARPTYTTSDGLCDGGNCFDCPSATTNSYDTCGYCAILPIVSNININDTALVSNGFVNLTFNSDLDNQQGPLVMYSVDWGDDEFTIVSGVEMVDRANFDDPHSLYHLYSYWDLKAKAASGVSGIDCTSVANTCKITPKVKIKDNWGWCNGGTSTNDCVEWETYKECSDGTVCNEDSDCSSLTTTQLCSDAVIEVKE